MAGAYGRGGYGSSPYGSRPEFVSFRVSGAVAGTVSTVVVSFSDPIDITYPGYINPANYTIPGLFVTGASIDGPFSVLLSTSIQSPISYTVEVTQARNVYGDYLDPLYRTATFVGIPFAPNFLPVGVQKSRIRLVFSEAVLANAAVFDPLSYVVTDIHGAVIRVLSVRSEQGAADPLAVALTIDTDMVAAEWYVITCASGIVAASSGLSLVPATQKMQWVEPTLNSSIAIAKFSGEVQGGLLTDHAGLVYFSPALDLAVPGSIIQIDSVEVCTKAFDEYVLPTPPDPPALYTFDGSVARAGVLNSGTVLWGEFPRLTEAQVNLAITRVEPMPLPVDGRCTATFTEQWDPSYVALLNVPAWALYDGLTALTPPTFICANNLGPIPPGATTTIVLQP